MILYYFNRLFSIIFFSYFRLELNLKNVTEKEQYQKIKGFKHVLNTVLNRNFVFRANTDPDNVSASDQTLNLTKSALFRGGNV